jgi:hypothetical protein
LLRDTFSVRTRSPVKQPLELHPGIKRTRDGERAPVPVAVDPRKVTVEEPKPTGKTKYLYHRIN